MAASYPGTLIRSRMKDTQRERDTYVALSILAFVSAIRLPFRVEGEECTDGPSDDDGRTINPQRPQRSR